MYDAMEQTVHINPTKVDRKQTNAPFVVFISLIFLTWIGIIIKVLTSESPEEPSLRYEIVSEVIEDESSKKIGEDDKSNIYQNIVNVIGGITLRFTLPFIVCTILSALIAFYYTYFLSLSKSKFVIDIAMYSLWIEITVLILFNVVLSVLLTEYMVVHLGYLLCLMITPYLIVSFLCARNIGTKAIFEIIKDSSGSVTCSLPIPLFVCGMSVIIALTSSITVYILFCTWSFSVGSFGTMIGYSFLNIFCAKALINFLVNFSHIVISGYVIDHYWLKGQQHSSSLDILKGSVFRTLRYHVGTLAFASIPLLSYICSIIQLCRHRDSDNDAIKIYNIFTRFYSQMCVLMRIVDFALIQTSIYGHDYLAAIMAAHDLVAKNNHEFNIAVCEVSQMVAMFGYFLMAIPFGYERIQSFVYSIIIPFSILFSSAVHALLVNKMIIDNASEALQEGCDTALTEIPKSEPPETEMQPSVY